MKRLVLALVSVWTLTAGPALAQGWDVMHLRFGGGSRPMQVERAADADFSVAYADSGAGMRFVVGACDGPHVGVGRLGEMELYWADGDRIRLWVDGEIVHETHEASFMNSQRHFSLPEQVVRVLAQGSELTLQREKKERYTVSLKGSKAALDQVRCK